MIVHTFSAYPHALAAVSDCLRLASPGDMFFFRDDSVYGLRQTQSDSLKLSGRTDISCSVLSDDLDIRGISAESLLTEVDCLDLEGFITLCTQADKVIHWG